MKLLLLAGLRAVATGGEVVLAAGLGPATLVCMNDGCVTGDITKADAKNHCCHSGHETYACKDTHWRCDSSGKDICSGSKSNDKLECEALMDIYRNTQGGGWTNNTGWGTDPDFCSWARVVCGANRKVAELHLDSNHLNGSIPETIGHLTSLKKLYLINSWLHGTLPAAIGKLTNLTDLEVSNPAWAKPSGLEGVSVDFSKMTQLQVLSLRANTIEGPFPAGLDRLKNLRTLDLSQNYMTGRIPTSLGALTSIVTLDLSQNRFDGPLPDVFSGMTQLQNLDVSATGIQI